MYFLTITVVSTVKINMGHTPTLTSSIFLPKMADKILTYNTNTIVGVFTGGGNSRSSWRKYVRQVFLANVISSSFPISSQWKIRVNIILSKEDALNINPHGDDHLVFTVQHGNWDIRCVLIDPYNSTNFMFWDAFPKLQLDPNDIKTFSGYLA